MKLLIELIFDQLIKCELWKARPGFDTRILQIIGMNPFGQSEKKIMSFFQNETKTKKWIATHDEAGNPEIPDAAMV